MCVPNKLVLKLTFSPLGSLNDETGSLADLRAS